MSSMSTFPCALILVFILVSIPSGLAKPWKLVRPHDGRHAITSFSSCAPSFVPSTELRLASVLSLRGGDDGDDDVDDSEYDEEDSDSSEDEIFGDLRDADFDVAEEDFSEENTLDRIKSAWKTTPPLTQLYVSASFFATAFGYTFNKNEFPKILTLEWKPVLTRLQIWRPITAFLNFGPFGFSYLMTAHFVWTYMSTLERLNHSEPYNFWIMVIFGQLSMVIGYPIFKLQSSFLGHNLSTFMVYIWSRYHEGIEVNMFELFNTRAELLPWFFLAQTFLLEGEPPILDFLGIVFGHVYYHCNSVGLLRAPPALVNWYKGKTAFATILRQNYRKISADFELL